MKRFLVCALALTAMLTFTACGEKKEEPKPEEAAEAEETSEDVDIVDTDFSKYAGSYFTADTDSITIDENGDVLISLFRLTEIEGKASGVANGIMPITGTDASGNAIGFEYAVESRTLNVVDSTWEYLKNGTSYTFDLTEAPEVGEPDEEEESNDDTDKGDIVDADLAAYAGDYATENEDTLTIDKDGNVVIAFIGLTEIEGKTIGAVKGIMPITGTDASGNAIELEFNVDTKELVVTDSTWEYLENGTSFVFDR